MAEGKMHVNTWERPLNLTSSLHIQLKRSAVLAILLVTDYIAVVAAIWMAYTLREYVIPAIFFTKPFMQSPLGIYEIVVIPLAVIFFMNFDGLYVRRMPLWQQTEKIFKVSLYAILIILMVMYFTETVKQLSRIYMALVWLFCFVFLALGRYFVKKAMIAANIWQIPAVIVGAGKTAEMLLGAFAQDAGVGYKVVGLIEDKNALPDVFDNIPVLGTFADAEQAIYCSGVKDVIIAAPGLPRESLVNLVYRLQPYVNNITFIPDLFGIPVGDIGVETLFNEKTVLLTIKNNLSNGYSLAVKRVFDIVFSLVGLVVIFPLLTLIVLLIRLDSPGSPVFVAKRMGKKGVPFDCYKFRTMHANSDEILEQYLSTNSEALSEWNEFAKLKTYDPRVTRYGAFLRKYSLDELPQIINVLKGEMSLVGPRPYLPREKERMGYYVETILCTSPGITGLWQVSGRNEISFEGRLALDCWYVRNWSVWLDLILLFRTIKVVTKKGGAY
ncbi:MAG TPA: undecaprenyl-phosphate galactose phosphotransferase WbaP [Patescibacteria group bacterium]|nr:undecaprenyl-phosphate galactose phosphotransferase WbaP [Patescibacteria group bacterium]